LITAVNELAWGRASTATIAFLRSLQGSLDVPATEKRVLFALNVYISIYNKQQLALIPGTSVKFTSTDKGPKEELDRMIVERVCLLFN